MSPLRHCEECDSKDLSPAERGSEKLECNDCGHVFTPSNNVNYKSPVQSGDNRQDE